MKKITLIFILSAIVITANAQQGLRIGLSGAFNSTWLFNKTVSDAGDALDYKKSFGGQGGIGALYTFNGGAGISLDVVYSSVNQKYANKDTLQNSYETESSITYISLPLLFRYTGEKGIYIEVGPEFSFLSGSDLSANGTSISYKSFTNSSNVAAVLGFGYDIKTSSQLVITTGLRFAWGLTDVYTTNPYESFYPAKGHVTTNTGVGGLHIGIAYKLR